MIAADQTLRLYSPARLACLYQRPVAAILRAADAAGVRPAIVLNDTPHFAEDTLETIREALRHD